VAVWPLWHSREHSFRPQIPSLPGDLAASTADSKLPAKDKNQRNELIRAICPHGRSS
jgi:hypothetical protein